MAVLIRVTFLNPTKHQRSRIKVQAVDDCIKYKSITVDTDSRKRVVNQARELVQSYSEQYLNGVECSPIARGSFATWYAVAGEQITTS